MNIVTYAAYQLIPAAIFMITLRLYNNLESRNLHVCLSGIHA